MKHFLTAVCLLAAAAVPASAHDTWLLATKGSLPLGATLELELTSGMAFPQTESEVAADRLARTGIRVGSRTRPLRVSGPRAGALRLNAEVGEPGVAVAWVETRPRTLELKPDEVRHYLEEIGALETVGKEWEASGRKPWRESYAKLAKAIARVGDAEDRSWAEPVGLALELVPESDPTRLRAGDTLRVRLLWEGQPLPDLAVGAVSAGGAPKLMRTDAEGRVAITIDGDGPWLVRATRVRPASLPDANWQSHFATLTFHVRPAR